jgi:hypothetical protein
MEEVSSSRSPKGSGEGRIELKLNSRPNCLCAHLVHSSLIRISERRMASKLLRCLDADRGAREREKADGKFKMRLLF